MKEKVYCNVCWILKEHQCLSGIKKIFLNRNLYYIYIYTNHYIIITKTNNLHYKAICANLINVRGIFSFD